MVATNRDTFDHIAPAWYGFRHWPLLREELEEVAARWSAGRLVNLGCAHGPDFLPFVGTFSLYGLDFSRGMLEQARAYMRKHRFAASLVQGDLVRLPFADATFDYAVSVAAYHHLEDDCERQGAFRELHRVLRPGGEVYLSVWNHLQPAFSSGPQDRLVPWQSAGQTLYRRYHLFTSSELQAHLNDAGFRVLSAGTEKRHAGASEMGRNICMLAERPPV